MLGHWVVKNAVYGNFFFWKHACARLWSLMFVSFFGQSKIFYREPPFRWKGCFFRIVGSCCTWKGNRLLLKTFFFLFTWSVMSRTLHYITGPLSPSGRDFGEHVGDKTLLRTDYVYTVWTRVSYNSSCRLTCRAFQISTRNAGRQWEAVIWPTWQAGEMFRSLYALHPSRQ